MFHFSRIQKRYFPLLVVILFAHHTRAFKAIEKRLNRTKLPQNERDDIMRVVREEIKSQREKDVREFDKILHQSKETIKREKEKFEKKIRAKRTKLEEELKNVKKGLEERTKLKRKKFNTTEKVNATDEFVKRVKSAKEKFENLAQEWSESLATEIDRLQEHFKTFLSKQWDKFSEKIGSTHGEFENKWAWVWDSLESMEWEEMKENAAQEQEKLGDKIEKLKKSIENTT